MSIQKGYQWLIKKMESEYEYPLNDCITFDEYFSILYKYNQHFDYFIRIYEIDTSKLIIKNKYKINKNFNDSEVYIFFIQYSIF